MSSAKFRMRSTSRKAARPLTMSQPSKLMLLNHLIVSPTSEAPYSQGGFAIFSCISHSLAATLFGPKTESNWVAKRRSTSNSLSEGHLISGQAIANLNKSCCKDVKCPACSRNAASKGWSPLIANSRDHSFVAQSSPSALVSPHSVLLSPSTSLSECLFENGAVAMILLMPGAESTLSKYGSNGRSHGFGFSQAWLQQK
eukprot:CAMPEP_0169108740 /NCGR_PEP_ID=MMETSP1015-20121227/25591_1 /TAXON_ID=342587 /ORGANISM="Karlodinium micrum, Strain CCMP2283" /LENGTH=198 /DNA_ID=CAMNT_0009170387 /DNA_START=430 /DNA_END=1026 /DNA_ORIENTATION=+